MQSARILLAAAAASLLLLGGTRLSQASAPVSPVIQKLIALDDRVHSFTANVQADVVMRSFPYLSTSLGGTYYHKQPSKDRIVFTSGVPFIAKAFSNVYPHVESPSRWNDVYDISVERDEGGFTTFKLVPRSHAHIDHIDAKIADASGELAQLRWNYAGGGYATLNQTYGRIGSYRLVTRESGHYEDSNYNADLSSTFSNFKVNVPIADSVFTQ